ncbi:hypothetical protein EDD86DRAFT_217899 [Gorgonomyces haynaldii]|nr:hypothetical protein EDD86DRAFT_217899 [Gorgonomyces haynaldii]
MNYRNQQIYQNFQPLSSRFMVALLKDTLESLRTRKDSAISPNMDNLKDLRLHTFGFIKNLLTSLPDGNFMPLMLEIHPTNIAIAGRIFLLDKKPLFIIDECQTKDEILFGLMRNVFRSLRVGLLLLGTDSKVKNMVNNKGSDSIDERLLWCHVYGNLPSTVMTTPSGLGDAMKFIVPFLKASRPVFYAYLVEMISGRYLLEAESKMLLESNASILVKVDCLLRYLFTRLSTGKSIFMKLEARLGQLCLFFNPYHQIAEDDILLYLTLMGGSGFHAFEHDLSETLLQCLSDVTAYYQQQNSALFPHNAITTKNDGMELDAAATVLLCYCLHLNGLGGISLGKFLAHLCQQLDPAADPTQDPGSVEVESKIVIPYLSPPNAAWPDALYEQAFHVVELERTSDSEQIDPKAYKKRSALYCTWICRNSSNRSAAADGAKKKKGYKICRLDVFKKQLLPYPSELTVERATKKLKLSEFTRSPKNTADKRPSNRKTSKKIPFQKNTSADKWIIFVDVGDIIRRAWNGRFDPVTSGDPD